MDATDKDSFMFSQAVESSHMINDFNGRESFLLWDKWPDQSHRDF